MSKNRLINFRSQSEKAKGPNPNLLLATCIIRGQFFGSWSAVVTELHLQFNSFLLLCETTSYFGTARASNCLYSKTRCVNRGCS